MRFLYCTVVLLVLVTACATTSDIERLEGKIDKLMLATKRSTLEDIFGQQTGQVSKQLKSLSEEQRRHFEDLNESYEKGAMTLEDVREKMVVLLGGGEREVSTPRGIYVRDLGGGKKKAVSMGTKLNECRKLEESEIPAAISEQVTLARFDWGIADLDGERVIFPWDLTMSSFAKEIVENTARRTAQELIKMGGELSRPVNIQVITEDDSVRVVAGDESEVYFIPKDKKPDSDKQLVR